MTEKPPISRHADDAYQALRAINHLTAHGAIPAPVLYDVLGHLKQLGPALTQALRQLGDALADSLTKYDVYNDDGTNPYQAIASCSQSLTKGATLASHLGDHLEAAQLKIAHQGYRTATD